MKLVNRFLRLNQPLNVVVFLLCAFGTQAAMADVAPLVDQAVLVRLTTAAGTAAVVDGETNSPTTGVESVNASYVSAGDWAVTGAGFVNAATFVFDLGQTATVSAATITFPIEETFAQNGAAPIQVFFFADNGVVEFTDYSVGFETPIAEIDAVGLTEIKVDVTGAVNASLGTSRFVGFRVRSAVEPGSVSATLFPAWTGLKLRPNPLLEFVSGPAPVLPSDSSRFDGFTLEVPSIDAADLGEVKAQFRLVDPNNLIFQLTDVLVSSAGIEAPSVSGIDLFNCNAFSRPPTNAVALGAASYSVNSGILDVPSVNFNGEQVAIRLELIDGSNPIVFETLSLGAVQSGPSDATVSALGGGIITESSQDFIPLCHGWALIGDSTRNRVVERNLITGETGATYSFGQNPDQFTLDEANGLVYMTVHPETERLYRLDLNTGSITSKRVTQTFGNEILTFNYSWALRDIALGENGNVFALMRDSVLENPENGLPYTNTGLWLGLMSGTAEFLTASIPLLEPVRVDYDPVRDHVFLATQSNLVTFNFDPITNAISFIQGTDIAVGSGCTDFDISPDGNRLAYTCPNGNRPGDPDFSIVDMAPDDYFNSSGEWFLGEQPVSATFDSTGTLLIATDNDKLFFYDVVTHLILEDFELGLLEGETIRKIRISKDGGLLYIFLNNEVHDPSSKFYWMPMPAITGTPLF
ncbi:MAG: hypothetical protein ACJAY7_000275 [Pseudohongiellaceae bacterium]|jgi:hypothetical protein